MSSYSVFNVRKFSNPQLVDEYRAIVEHITQYIHDEGRTPFWMIVDRTLIESELLRRMR